jgi:hypothetical protein
MVLKTNEIEAEMSKGEYTITLDTENGIVRVVAQGKLDKALGEEIITKARKSAAEFQYPILCDVGQAEVKVSFADWFFLPRTLPVYKNYKIRTIKAALLISPGNQEREYDFYETVTQNMGMNLRVFLKETVAVEWLKES